MTENKSNKGHFFRIFNIMLVLILIISATPFSAKASSGAFDTEAQIELEPGAIELTAVPTLEIAGDITEFRNAGGGRVHGIVAGDFVIEDARGTNKGWSVYVSFGRLRNADIPFDPYKGIGTPTISLPAPDIKAEAGGTTFKGYAAKMVAGDGNFYKIATAPPGTKGGTWYGTFPGEVTMDLGGGVSTGKFQGKMNWSIQDTP